MNIAEQVTRLKTDFDEVYDAGKQAEYDRFWDLYQANGIRTYYSVAFGGSGWNDETFKPKYDIKPTATYAYMMFRNTGITDMVEILNRQGIELSFSKVTGCAHLFYDSAVTRLGTIDLSSMNGSLTSTFHNCDKLHTIEKLIFPTDNVVTDSNAFNGATALVNLTMEGLIQRSFNFNWSPLSVASMKSIISCLADLTGTAGEGVYTIQFSSACWDALEADSIAPDGNTWADYVTSLGWVI